MKAEYKKLTEEVGRKQKNTIEVGTKEHQKPVEINFNIQWHNENKRQERYISVE